MSVESRSDTVSKPSATETPTPLVYSDKAILRAKGNAKAVNNIKLFVKRELGVGKVGSSSTDV
jgi:hypothetical protein